jgi:hypothetical protein
VDVDSHEIRINGVESLDGVNGPLGSTSDPIQPDPSRSITDNNTDPGDTQSLLPGQLEDGNEFTLTFRDHDLSPIGGPDVDPGAPGLVSTSVLTVFASDETVTSTVEVIVQTVNDGTDTLSDGIQITLDETFDFTGGALGWTSVVLSGATTAQNAGGLCITAAAAPNASLGLWQSGANHTVNPVIELTDGKLYLAQLAVTTTTTDPDEIPLVIASHSSLAFGGQMFWLDVVGGANGIGRPQGLDTLDYWLTPMPVRLASWSAGAFQPAEDAQNDIRMEFNVPNLNPNINFQIDNGTVCMASLSVFSGDVGDLGGTSVYGPFTPTDAVFDAVTLVDSTLAADDNLPHSASFVGAGARLVVAPVNGPQAQTNTALPAAGLGVLASPSTTIPWNSGVILDGQITMASESGGTDPVDAVFAQYLAETSETGGTVYITSGAPGGVFDEAGSPTVGEDRVFTALFFTSNQTLLGGAETIAFSSGAVNRPDLGGVGASGADPLLIKSIDVQENEAP